MRQSKNWKLFIEEHTMDGDISRRGGGLKVDVSELFPDVSEPVMGAYQNYLGGGMLGKVCGGAMFSPDELKTKADRALFEVLLEEIKKYFFYITNEIAADWDEWSAQDYKQNQSMPVSAY